MRIAITLPTFYTGESKQIEALLADGQFDLVHLRKPQSSKEEMQKLITEIAEPWRSRLVLHEHHNLCTMYGLHGIHLNMRNPEPPRGYWGRISRSCHSLEEVELWKQQCDYVFLSPIFDSISKVGYTSRFTPDEIAEAARRGIIDHKVIALGGVTEAHMRQLEAWNFGGGAMLGSVWKMQKAQISQ